MPCWTHQLWPHNLNQTVSGKAGAVQIAKYVRIPTLLYQVKDDALTRPDDIQGMFDNIPIPDKELIWIEGTSSRWDGYLYFQRKPERMIAWFNQYMH